MRTLAEWTAHFAAMGMSAEHAATAATSSFNAEQAQNAAGIEASNKKNGENVALRKKLTDAGYDKEKHGSTEEFLAGLTKSATDALKLADDGKTEMQKMIESNNALTERLNASDQAAIVKQGKLNTQTMTTKLTEAFGGAKPKLYSHAAHIESILSKKQVGINEAGQVVGLKADGTEQGFDEFAKGYLETNKADLAVAQKPGSGKGAGFVDATSAAATADLSQFDGQAVDEIDIGAAREAMGLKK
jgi:hypothetical protein